MPNTNIPKKRSEQDEKIERRKRLPIGKKDKEKVVEGEVEAPIIVERERERERRGPRRPEAAVSDLIEKVVTIKRVTKVTKGGKKLHFSALVVVGDTKGRVGYSLEKSTEVASAIRKSLNSARKSMVVIPLRGATIPHEVIGECGAARVLLKPASAGTGVIAAGPVRAICDAVGIRDILTKCHRSNNPINVVKAVMEGLTRLKTAQN